MLVLEDVQECALRAKLDARYQGSDEPRGQPLAAMVGLGADGADLGPAVQMKPLAGHRDERPVAADPQVVAKLDGPGQKRSRFGLGDELEHLGHIGGAERDRLRAIDPGDPLSDHLHQIERLDRLPTVRQLGVAVPDAREGTRRDETGGITPVLRRRRRGQRRGTARRRPDIGARAHSLAQAAHEARTAPRTPDCRAGLRRPEACHIKYHADGLAA